jgi:hypothetical protein
MDNHLHVDATVHCCAECGKRRWRPLEKWMNGCRDAPDFLAHANTSGKQANNGEPLPTSFIWTAAIQSGHRSARRNLSHQRTQGNVLWQRGGRGRLWGWVRPLCCRRHSNLQCIRSDIGDTPSINRRSVLEAPFCFIWIGYHWISSDLSGKAEKRSNCEMRSNIMHEWGGDGRGGEIIHCSNQQMTTNGAKVLGDDIRMDPAWQQARMRMIGVVLTPLSGACILGICYCITVCRCDRWPAAFGTIQQWTTTEIPTKIALLI